MKAARTTTLRPFFRQAVYGTEILDYAVDGFSSEPVDDASGKNDSRPKQYLSTVNLRRKGDFILPVTAEIVFTDGSRVREHWDGAEWTADESASQTIMSPESTHNIRNHQVW